MRGVVEVEHGGMTRAVSVLFFLPIWYYGLVYFRDDLGMGDVYLILSGFFVIFVVIGFTPRAPGEISAYSHMNENHERILGSLDANRAGRELTGAISLDMDDTQQQNAILFKQNGHVLGKNTYSTLDDHDEHELQRALLLSLQTEREERLKKQQLERKQL